MKGPSCRLQCKHCELGRAIEAEGKANGPEAAIHIKLHRAELEVAHHILLPHRR